MNDSWIDGIIGFVLGMILGGILSAASQTPTTLDSHRTSGNQEIITRIEWDGRTWIPESEEDK